ncbi:MAG: hypothetical protein NVSMB64_12550 [Candidatus Velthaea sp.]
MNSPASTHARDRSAIACSIGAHLCALALLAGFALPDVRPVPELLPRASLFRFTLVPRNARPRPNVERITMASPLVSSPPAKPPTAGPPASHPPAARSVRASVAGVHGPRTLPSPSAAPETPVTLALVAPPVPSAVSTATPAPVPTSTVSPAAATASTPAPLAAADGGLFGKNYGAIPNPPSALAAIRAKIVGHFHIRIHVDETGHAIEVRFLTPLADTAVADDVRAKLLALNYVPADCNGLPCSDDLDVKY